ncbi:hypothetical protein [Nonomuraea ferruginea]|uniref:Uncharacterized protein n=1 Tax=Nonomuraea ferruginea TaxID=46174 RepID=A0ABT4T8L9_9ACTN|nr:hypothetical protein [Nonomuraea ferruginea]MDA0645864.1 hypothetical protein [Nonomuraea ferruginea]
MTNGVRHVLGFVAGLFLPSLILVGLLYGTGEITLSAQRFFAVSWAAIGVLVVTAIGLAFLVGSRLSPVASLLGGLQYTVLGLLPILELGGTRLLPTNWLPLPLARGYMNAGYLGFLLLLGVLLLAASAFPSRWRGRPRTDGPPAPYYAPGPHAYSGPAGPSGPPPAAERDPYAGEPWRGDDATRPMRRD